MQTSRSILLAGKSLHGRDPRGPLRWQQTSGERRRSHDSSGARECRPIKSRHVEENRLHGLPGQPCSDEAKYHARGEQTQGEGEELTADLLRPSSQRHSHADFAATLRHGITQYSIRADGGEEQGYGGEEASQECR